jgi:hypothetical protein
MDRLAMMEKYRLSGGQRWGHVRSRSGISWQRHAQGRWEAAGERIRGGAGGAPRLKPRRGRPASAPRAPAGPPLKGSVGRGALVSSCVIQMLAADTRKCSADSVVAAWGGGGACGAAHAGGGRRAARMARPGCRREPNLAPTHPAAPRAAAALPRPPCSPYMNLWPRRGSMSACTRVRAGGVGPGAPRGGRRSGAWRPERGRRVPSSGARARAAPSAGAAAAAAAPGAPPPPRCAPEPAPPAMRRSGSAGEAHLVHEHDHHARGDVHEPRHHVVELLLRRGLHLGSPAGPGAQRQRRVPTSAWRCAAARQAPARGATRLPEGSGEPQRRSSGRGGPRSARGRAFGVVGARARVLGAGGAVRGGRAAQRMRGTRPWPAPAPRVLASGGARAVARACRAAAAPAAPPPPPPPPAPRRHTPLAPPCAPQAASPLLAATLRAPPLVKQLRRVLGGRALGLRVEPQRPARAPPRAAQHRAHKSLWDQVVGVGRPPLRGWLLRVLG